MDYVTRQFIVLAKKLRDEFHKLSDTLHRDLSHLSNSVKDLDKSINKQGKPDKETRQSKPSISISDFRATVPITVENKTKKTAIERVWVVIKSAFEVGGIAAVVWYACITNSMWKEMIKQTETGQRQLEQTQRAWLTVEVTADTGFEFTNDGGARINIRPHIKNIGQSPATGISSIAKLILAPMGSGNKFFSAPVAQQNELCEKIAKNPISSAKTISAFQQVIFPSDTDEATTQGLNVSKDEIAATKQDVVGKSGPESLLAPFVVGCIDYQYATAIQHHQTGFVYILQHRDRTLPPNIYPIRAIRVGHSISAKDVEIQKWAFGGFYAY